MRNWSPLPISVVIKPPASDSTATIQPLQTRMDCGGARLQSTANPRNESLHTNSAPPNQEEKIFLLATEKAAG
jgi:hypothetical protein